MLKAIAAHTVLDLEFAHPTLEEVFLTYYQAGAGAEGGGTMTALIAAQLRERRRSLLSWGLPLGLVVGLRSSPSTPRSKRRS